MNIEHSPSIFVGVLGLGMLNVVSLYQGSAPDLKELRTKPVGDDDSRQALMDADIMIGAVTLLVAVSAAITMKSGWPIVLLFGGFAFVSFWHHLVLNSPQY